MIQIVPMNESHIEQICAIERQCFSLPWSAQSFYSELSNKLSYWLVAEDQGAVAGYIGSQTVMDESDVMNVAVSEDFRRQGIGRMLVEQLIADLSKKGISSLTLEVRLSNDPAIKLYEQFGFEKVGVRKGYYSRPKEDALIYRKEL